MKILSLCAATALAAMPAIAQASPDAAPVTLQKLVGSDRLTIRGSGKIRYESYDNSFRPTGAASADLLTLRTTLEMEYRGDGFRVGGELRDTRGYWADRTTPVTASEINTLEPIQLYIGVDLGGISGNGKAELTAGRFLLNLGSRRLVGATQFRATGNGYTGLRFDWTGEGKQTLTLFYTLPQQRGVSDIDAILDNRAEWDHEGDDLQFWGGIIGVPKLVAGLHGEAYVYGLREDDRPGLATRNRHLVTAGGRLFARPARGRIDTEAEAIYQFGTIRRSTAADAGKLDVSAYLLHAELGYSFPVGWQPRISVAGDLASGDHAGSKSYNRFDSLFGTRRWEYGPTGIFGPLHRNNTVSLVARAEARPSDRVDMMMAWRQLWLDSATDSFSRTGVIDPTGQSGRKAGAQAEARVRWWLLPRQVQLDLGGALLVKGPFLRNAPNAPDTGDSRYGYADLTVFF